MTHTATVHLVHHKTHEREFRAYFPAAKLIDRTLYEPGDLAVMYVQRCRCAQTGAKGWFEIEITRHAAQEEYEG